MTWVHWVVYTCRFDAWTGGGRNIAGRRARRPQRLEGHGWRGLSAVRPHRYFFNSTLDACCRISNGRPSASEKAMPRHVLAQAELVGTYQKSSEAIQRVVEHGDIGRVFLRIDETTGHIGAAAWPHRPRRRRAPRLATACACQIEHRRHQLAGGGEWTRWCAQPRSSCGCRSSGLGIEGARKSQGKQPVVSRCVVGGKGGTGPRASSARISGRGLRAPK